MKNLRTVWTILASLALGLSPVATQANTIPRYIVWIDSNSSHWGVVPWGRFQGSACSQVQDYFQSNLNPNIQVQCGDPRLKRVQARQFGRALAHYPPSLLIDLTIVRITPFNGRSFPSRGSNRQPSSRAPSLNLRLPEGAGLQIYGGRMNIRLPGGLGNIDF